MGALHIMVANEPRAYREALARALQIQRPTFDIILMEPDELAAVLAEIEPNLLIASELPPGLSASLRTWLLLYPGGANRGVIGRAGQSCRTIEQIGLDDILALIDRLDEAGPRPLDSHPIGE